MAKTNRRDFIKAGAGAFFIASAGKAIGAGAPSNRVRLGIMGCRKECRGVWLMRAGVAMKDAEIAAVCETDRRGLDFAAEEVKEKTGKMPMKCTDMRKMLEDPTIDGILCEVPDHWHAPAAWMAMNAGKAIYVEKPCTMNGEECQVLMDVQKRTGQVFQMGSQRRSSSTYRRWIPALPKLLGEPKFARCWYTSRRGPGPKRGFIETPAWLDWESWQGPTPHQGFENGLVHYGWHSDKGWEWPDTQHTAYKFADGKTISMECYCNANFLNPQEIGTGAVVYYENGAVLFHPKDAIYIYDNRGRKIAEEADPSCDEWIQSTTGASYLDTNHLTNFVEAIRMKDPSHCFSPVVTGCASTLMAHTGNMAADTGEKILVDAKTGKLLNKSAAVRKLWSREYEKGWEPKKA